MAWVGNKLKCKGVKIWQAGKYPRNKKVTARDHQYMLNKHFPKKGG